jgi:hypothetical protein
MTGQPREARLRPSPAALLVALVLLVAAACGTGIASPSASTGSVSGSASAAGSAGTGEAEPSPTRWPGGVVEAVMILAKADAQIQAAGGDLGAAAAYEDLKAMWGAADGLVTLVTRLQPQVPRIAEYPETAAAAAAYDAAFPDMLAGATKLRDSITAGDAQGMQDGSVQLAKGIAAYEGARRAIGPLADQALLMQRLLTK